MNGNEQDRWGLDSPEYGTGYFDRFHGNAQYSPYGPTFAVMSDDAIEQEIYNALDADPLIPRGATIGVEVAAGGVTLTGTVPNREAKRNAAERAYAIPAVRDVTNKIQIRR